MKIIDASRVHAFFQAKGRCQCKSPLCPHYPDQCNKLLILERWEVIFPENPPEKKVETEEGGIAVCEECYEILKGGQ